MKKQDTGTIAPTSITVHGKEEKMSTLYHIDFDIAVSYVADKDNNR